MHTLPTCHHDGCERVAVVSTITRAGVVGPGCLEHVILHADVTKKRDVAEVDVYRRDRLDRPAAHDYLTDAAVEITEHHYQQRVVGVEYALAYLVLLEDGTVCSGALAPLEQGDAVTSRLLSDTAPRIAERAERKAADDE